MLLGVFARKAAKVVIGSSMARAGQGHGSGFPWARAQHSDFLTVLLTNHGSHTPCSERMDVDTSEGWILIEPFAHGFMGPGLMGP